MLNIKTFVFPTTYDLYEQRHKKYGYSSIAVKDLSGKTKVKDEDVEMTLYVESITELEGIKNKLLSEVAESYGVKPL